MKRGQLRWAPRTLTAAQRLVRVKLAQRMLQALAKHKQNHFHFLFTGGESWMLYADNRQTM
jgi:N-acetyl-beta-hexosaminidase